MDRETEKLEILIEQQKRVRKDIAIQYLKARQDRKLTQDELAKKMNIKRPNISRFESGDYNPTVDMLVKMAECLNMKLIIKLENNMEDNNG